MPGGEMRPATEAVLTMWPSSCAIRRGAKALMPCTTPRRLTPRIHSHSASLVSHTGPDNATPALLQTTCTLFSSAATRLAKRFTSPDFETSTRIEKLFNPNAATSVAVWVKPRSEEHTSELQSRFGI